MLPPALPGFLCCIMASGPDPWAPPVEDIWYWNEHGTDASQHRQGPWNTKVPPHAGGEFNHGACNDITREGVEVESWRA